MNKFLKTKKISSRITNELSSYRAKELSKGQILLEAMISLTIITVSILGIFALLSNSIGQARVSANQVTAVYLAAEGIEVVKNIIDQNYLDDPNAAWNRNLNDCGTGCSVQYDSIDDSGNSQDDPLLFNTTTKTYAYDNSGDETIFFRELTINTASGGDELIVVSTVTWRERRGSDTEVVLEDRFFDWREN